MAQTRFLEYLADDDTFSLNLQMAGIFPSGCYRGFDTAETVTMPVNAGNIMMQFKHEESGFSYRDKDGITRSNNSLCISNQGVKIVENSSVNVQTKEVISGQRIDAIVMRHFYASTEGGTYATYISIQGTSTDKPIIQVDDVLLGWLLVTPTSVTWQKVDARQFGGLNFADQQNVFTAKQMTEILPIGVLGGVLNVSEGNCFTVYGGTISFLTATIDSITKAQKNGSRVMILCLSDTTFKDISDIQFSGISSPPSGQKWINTNNYEAITVLAGGFIELIEMEDFYNIVNVFDHKKNPIWTNKDLGNKQFWWFDNGFITSVKEVILRNNIINSINSSIIQVSTGIVKMLVQENIKNIITVNIPITEPFINSIDIPYPAGTEFYINFVSENSCILNCSSTDDLKNFRAITGNQFSIKNGSIAKFLQKENGIWLISGLSQIEQWVTPILPSQVSVFAHNGNFKYKICENGRIEFEGSLSIQSGTPQTVILTLPRSLFLFQDWVIHKRLFVPPFEGILTQSSYIYYYIDGLNVKFYITTDNYITTFDFNGTYLNYK